MVSHDALERVASGVLRRFAQYCARPIGKLFATDQRKISEEAIGGFATPIHASVRDPGDAEWRCRMYGGTSPGRPIIRGRNTRATLNRRREWLVVLQDLNDLIERVDG